MTNKTTASTIFICLIAIGISGCATSNTAAISQAAKYRNMGERRLLTTDGKKTEVLATAEEYERLGDMNLKKGDVSAAFINYTTALHKEPERISAAYKTGRLFLLKDMTEEARNEFEKILKKEPDNALGHEGLGRAYLLEGDVDKAVEYLTKAVTINKTLWEAHNLLGVAYDKQRKFTRSIYQYRLAISIKPEVGALYNNLGVAYFMNNEYEKARNSFIGAIEKKEEGSKVYNNLAMTYGKLGEYKAAHEAFKRAGTAASAQNNIGYLYMLENKNEEAATAFEKAMELNPTFYPQAHDNLNAAKEALQN